MKSFTKPVYIFVMLVLVFVALIGLMPADAGEMQRLGLTAPNYRIFFLLLELPLVIVRVADEETHRDRVRIRARFRRQQFVQFA